MFIINADKSIYLTRGDVATIEVCAKTNDGNGHAFIKGDVVRLVVVKKGSYSDVVLVKEVIVEEASTSVDISLDRTDTKLGDVINKPVDYWYEVELNPDTYPQTIVGHDSDGPKIFRLFPEGSDAR